MDCVVETCILKDPRMVRWPCNEPNWLCKQVYYSVDPEDRPSYEQWVKEHGNSIGGGGGSPQAPGHGR